MIKDVIVRENQKTKVAFLRRLEPKLTMLIVRYIAADLRSQSGSQIEWWAHSWPVLPLIWRLSS